jgi:hypothetical protein
MAVRRATVAGHLMSLHRKEPLVAYVFLDVTTRAQSDAEQLCFFFFACMDRSLSTTLDLPWTSHLRYACLPKVLGAIL